MNKVDTRVQLKQSLDERVEELIEETVKHAVGNYTHLIQKSVSQRFDQLIEQVVSKAISEIKFPQASINHNAIDFTGCNINRLEGVDKLRISGIESFTQDVQLTVLDDNVVVENKLIADTISVDNLSVNNLTVKHLELDTETYDNIKHDILVSVPVPRSYDEDIKRLEEKLSRSKAGNFNELEVSGETLLSDVLYTTPGNRRVGINTMDPSDALTVWDQETEVVIGKHKAQEGYIGTRRRQDINIGANNKVGITVRSDGSVAISKLELLGRTISESASVPGHAAKKGDIVLNSKPEQGNPIGWVCLDGIRWSGFGVVQ